MRLSSRYTRHLVPEHLVDAHVGPDDDLLLEGSLVEVVLLGHARGARHEVDAPGLLGGDAEADEFPVQAAYLYRVEVMSPRECLGRRLEAPLHLVGMPSLVGLVPSLDVPCAVRLSLVTDIGIILAKQASLEVHTADPSGHGGAPRFSTFLLSRRMSLKV